MGYSFSKASLAARAKLLPCLQVFVDRLIEEIDFKILDATRGRAAQRKAQAQGNSKVGFGNSAHNYVPALAVDLFPAPYNWPDDKLLTAKEKKEARDAFLRMGKLGLAIPSKHNILGPDGKPLVLRWGGDWNMDGNTSDGWDMPHFEIHPWRNFRKFTKLYED